MTQRSKHYNIWIIFQVQFPQICPEEKPTSIEHLQELMDNIEDNLSLYDEEEISEFYSAKKQFSILRKQADNKLHETADMSLTVIENNHPLNQIEYLATDGIYKQWLRYEYLTIEEAAILAVGRNPEKLSEIMKCDDLGFTRIKCEISDAIRILERHHTTQKDTGKVSQKNFLTWLAEYDSKHTKAIQKMASATKSKSRNKNKLRSRSAINNERNKMLQLIIGMAIDKYGYDKAGTKPSPAGKISSRLANHEIKVSDDTIRSYLQEARELID